MRRRSCIGLTRLPASYLIKPDAAITNTHVRLNNCFIDAHAGDGLDLTTLHSDAVVLLGPNAWSAIGGSGVAIKRGTAPVDLGGRYAESPQIIDNSGTMTQFRF